MKKSRIRITVPRKSQFHADIVEECDPSEDLDPDVVIAEEELEKLDRQKRSEKWPTS